MVGPQIMTAPKRRRRRKSRKTSAPKTARRRSRRGRKHTHWGQVHSHKRRVNPRRKHRRHHARRRRNPGFLSSILSPIKEHALGFAAGSIVNSMAISPLLGSLLAGQPLAQSASKIVVGPALGALGKRFLPKFSRTWDSLAIFFVAIGINETVSQLTGSMMPATAAKGLGWAYTTTPGRTGIGSINAMGSIGPTMGSIGPTMSGIGAAPTAVDYQAYSEDGSY